MNNWELKQIGEVVEIRRGASPRPIDAFLSETGMPWVKISDATESDSRYIFKTKQFIRESGVKNSVVVNPEDLIISNSATPGLPKILKIKACVHDGWLVISDYSGITRDFLYYSIKQNRKSLIKQGNGSIFTNLKTDILKEFKIKIPSIEYQNKITDVLTCIEDKIELNQRINAELESMAKTLYDYWFVQNAKVGKWQVGKLGDFIKINERSITKDYAYDEVEYIDIASVSVGRLDGTTKYALKDAPSRARRLVQHGDTIWSTVRPNRKSFLFICNPKENLVVSTGFAVLTPKKIPPSFLYFLTTTEQFVNFLVSNAEGSAYPAVSADRFAEMEFLIPPEKKLEEFENIVSPMLAKISKNELESQTLTELRDWLLPMLMNGQVKVN